MLTLVFIYQINEMFLRVNGVGDRIICPKGASLPAGLVVVAYYFVAKISIGQSKEKSSSSEKKSPLSCPLTESLPSGIIAPRL